MLVTRKVKVLLYGSDEHQSLQETAEAFRELFNYITIVGWEMSKCSRYSLHHEVYHKAREKFPNLPAQYVITCIGKAAIAIKSAKTKQKQLKLKNSKKLVRCPQMKKARILSLDTHLITIQESTAKITALGGRFKVNLQMYPYIQDVWQYKRKGCEIKENNGTWYLHVTFDLPDNPKSQNQNILGIDRGIKNIAVCSNNKFFNSKHLRKVKAKYQFNRKCLQSKGTKSAKKALRILSGKENRFVRDTNHCISKKIVNMDFGLIALEKLGTHTRKKLGKSFNKRLGSWSWGMLESFIKYKGALLGKTVINVPAKYTSQACSVCGHTHKSNRSGAIFKCKSCGFELHSDLNAAKNIRNIASNQNNSEGMLSASGCRQPAKRVKSKRISPNVRPLENGIYKLRDLSLSS